MPKLAVQHIGDGLKYLPDLQFVCEDEDSPERAKGGWPEAAILEIGPENIRSLSLSRRKLRDLPEDQLSRLVNCEAIAFAENDLNDIPAALKNLPRLKSINLRDNPLVCLPPELRSKASRGSIMREELVSYLSERHLSEKHSSSRKLSSRKLSSTPSGDSSSESESETCSWLPFSCCGYIKKGREFDLDAVIALREDTGAKVGSDVTAQLRKLDNSLRVAVHSDRTEPGESARTREAIGRARSLVLLLSEGVLECPHALADVTEAVESGRTVVALKPEGAPEPPLAEALTVPGDLGHSPPVVRAAVRAATTRKPLDWPGGDGKALEEAAQRLLALVRGI